MHLYTITIIMHNFMETKTWNTCFIIRYKVRFYITHNFYRIFLYKNKCARKKPANIFINNLWKLKYLMEFFICTKNKSFSALR